MYIQIIHTLTLHTENSEISRDSSVQIAHPGKSSMNRLNCEKKEAKNTQELCLRHITAHHHHQVMEE